MLNFVSFPPVNQASEDGLLAMGGDLSADTLISAYSQGIFPWFNEDQPILWWSPDPRLILHPNDVKVSRSLAKVIRQRRFSLSCNQEFEAVMKGCALRGITASMAVPADTWITDSMHKAYAALHNLGYAHSIEVWQDSKLVGGLYGLALGQVFFGESMFSRASNASKIALVGLCQHLHRQEFKVIDCQMETEHLVSMGADAVSRDEFLSHLSKIDINQKHEKFAQDFEQACT